MSKRLVPLLALVVAGLAVACGGGGEPSRTVTPEPSPGGTPARTAAVTTPSVASTPLGPSQPVPLEEGAAITGNGAYVADIESGRVWKVAEVPAWRWSPSGSALMVLNGGIEVVDMERGSTVRILSDDPTAAAWSPNGSQIAFSRNDPGPQGPKGLYVINSDGSGLKQLSERGAYPLEWSPRGDYIASSVWLDHVYVLDVVSGETVDLEDVGGYALAWSPDGAALAFTNDNGLYVYDADTGERRQVAVGPSGGTILWSPDGSRIAFRFGPRVALGPATDMRMLHVVEVDGPGEPKPLPPARNPSWSPDGAKIAYLSEGCITGDWDIYTADRDGGSPVRLTGTPDAFKEGPFWSPTGPIIAFITDNSDDLMLLNAESGELQTLASGGPQSGGPGIHLHDPPWSPDGRYIMFSAGGAHGVCD